MRYEAKVKYMKLNEISGKEQNITESYIIRQAETFADAEAQTFIYMEERTPQTVIPAIKISDIEEIYDGAGDWYYKARIVSSTIDEINGKETQISVILLIQKNNFQDALEECISWMSGSLFDCEVVSLTKTKIVDII